MTTTTSPASETVNTAGRRRAVYGLRTFAMLFAITTCCIFAALLGSRASARLDVTVTRQHLLSPRTMELLGRLEKPYEVVIAVDPRTVDPATWERTTDVLDAFEHASRNVVVRTLNTGSTSGIEEFERLMRDLADRYRPRIDAARTAVEGLAGQTEQIAAASEGLSKPLLEVRESLTAGGTTSAEIEQLRAVLEQRAAMARVKADELRASAAAARKALAGRVGPVPVPPTDDAARLLRGPVNDAAVMVSELHDYLAALLGRESLPGASRDGVRAVVGSSLAMRDQAARAVAAIDGVSHPPVLTVARALQQNAAALVIGPPDAPGAGLTAIDLDALLPARAEGARGPSPDFRFRAEDLITAGIWSLSSAANPIVVFVHDLPREEQPFPSLMDRLRLRGIDSVEWRTVADADPPAARLRQIDPSGKRPVVYAVVVSGLALDQAGALRMGRLSNAAAKLAAAGESMLVSVAPSSLPGAGSPDPMTQYLERLGVRVKSGLPILRQEPSPAGRVVQLVEKADPAPAGAPPASSHPIAEALRGLHTHLVLPLQVEAMGPGKPGETPPTVTPLLTLGASPDVWAEADWLDLVQPGSRTPGAAKAPAPDSPRDVIHPDQPWTVGAAVERIVPGRKSPQRLVVVGSYGWFTDKLLQQIPGSAGNLELFEASVYWLAGQDEMIGQSAAAQAVALIPPMSGRQLSLLRWSLVAGLPLLVLVMGVAWRMLKG